MNDPITTYQGFDLDQSRMTPAYLSDYRPAYGGDSSVGAPVAPSNALRNGLAGVALGMFLSPKNPIIGGLNTGIIFGGTTAIYEKMKQARIESLAAKARGLR